MKRKWQEFISASRYLWRKQVNVGDVGGRKAEPSWAPPNKVKCGGDLGDNPTDEIKDACEMFDSATAEMNAALERLAKQLEDIDESSPRNKRLFYEVRCASLLSLRLQPARPQPHYPVPSTFVRRLCCLLPSAAASTFVRRPLCCLLASVPLQ